MSFTASRAALFATFTLIATGCGDSAQPKADTSSAPATTTADVASNSSTPSAVASDAAPPASAPSATADATPSAATSSSSKVASSSGAPTAKSEGSGEPVKGEEKTGGAYSAFMTASKSYKAGQQGTVTAIVNALGDYHVNQEFPYKVKLDAPSGGVTFPSDTVRDVSRTEKRATISIPFTASEAGAKTISGTCSLSVCTKDQCVIEKVPLSVTVKVE